ncbi:cystin-1 [Loxodonta africana]|uniref:cystin-1 n=1 Tax=Loxodonta africana TaxID=9785 RepID=UPI0030D283E5
MGSGSSRSSRALKRLRSRESRPVGPGGAAPEGGPGPLGGAAAEAPEEAPKAAAVAVKAEGEAGRDPGPAAPPDSGNETLLLLDQLLAESATWDPGELASRGATRPRPARGAGSPVTPKQSTEDYTESSSVSETPNSSHKRPERQSAILYDYSEEELMASIEREYCR